LHPASGKLRRFHSEPTASWQKWAACEGSRQCSRDAVKVEGDETRTGINDGSQQEQRRDEPGKGVFGFHEFGLE